MDAADLKQVLEQLDTLTPRAAGRVATVLKDAEELDRRVTALRETQERHLAEAEVRLDEVESAAANLERESRDQRAAVAERVQQVARAGDAARDTLREWTEERLPAARRRAEAAFDDLDESLQHAAEAARESGPSLDGAVVALAGAARTGRDRLTRAIDDVLQRGDALRETMRAAADRFEALKPEVESEVERRRAEVQEAVDDAAAAGAALEAMLEDHASSLEALLEQGTAELGEIFEGGTDRLVAHLAGVRARIEEGLEAFGESLAGHQQAVEVFSDALQPLVQQVEDRLDPIQNAIEAVRAAASRVGLPFA